MSTISLNSLLPARTSEAYPFRRYRGPGVGFDESVYAKIMDEGGCTISVSGSDPSAGYAFSEYKQYEESIPIDEFSSQHVKRFRVKHEKLLAHPDHYIGGWFNKDNGEVYLDISTVLPERREAMARARGDGQTAIWDLGKLEEIRVEEDSRQFLNNNRSAFQNPRITRSRRSKRTAFPFESLGSKPARRSVKRRSAAMGGAKSISDWNNSSRDNKPDHGVQ